MSFICHIHNNTEYNQQWNVFSAFNPSKHSHLEQWAADTAAPGEQLGVWCLALGSHLSRGQYLPELRFEPTTSGYKSNALSIRATTAPPLTEYNRLFIKQFLINTFISCGSAFIIIHYYFVAVLNQTHTHMHTHIYMYILVLSINQKKY